MAWKPNAAVLSVKRIRALHGRHRERKEQTVIGVKSKHRPGGFIVSRNFEDYNTPFSFALKSFLGSNEANLLGLAAALAKGRSVLRVMDDGAGEGHFLAGFKSKLGREGITTMVTAVSMMEEPHLAEYKAKGEIDNVIIDDAELFVPEKPFDLITSMYGSVNYAMPEIAKEHLLKLSHCLRRGGFMLVGFSDIYWKKGYSGKRPSYTPAERERSAIERAFEKRGFRAKFIECPFLFIGNPPETVLVIQRK